ncbi:MAG: hypothetical protein AAF318_03240 [Pseudomonadota bacterium]
MKLFSATVGLALIGSVLAVSVAEAQNDRYRRINPNASVQACVQVSANNNCVIDQNSRNNVSGVMQAGRNNNALVRQRGDNNRVIGNQMDNPLHRR